MHLPELDSAAYAYRFLGISALERFLRLPPGPTLFVEVDAGMVEIASLYENPSFPGLPGWDLRVESAEREVLVRCNDLPDPQHPTAGDGWSDFSWEPRRHAFRDPQELYPFLKELRRQIMLRPKSTPLQEVEALVYGDGEIKPQDAISAAMLTARLPLTFPEIDPTLPAGIETLPPDYHRIVLTQIIEGPWAWRGLELLRQTGYIAKILPELDEMNRTDHSKEGHPEGNVWSHTLETFRYRKNRSLEVGLALLLHDSGKPVAQPNGEKKFDGHADIGARVGRTVLRRLGFPETIVESVQWLIRNHMIPGALRRLPEYRRDPVMSSALFPLLLEVYRCDLSSTFRGPANYYEACRIYRSFLKSERGRQFRPTRELALLYRV